MTTAISVKLLFDPNLSPRLLVDLYPGAIHILGVFFMCFFMCIIIVFQWYNCKVVSLTQFNPFDVPVISELPSLPVPFPNCVCHDTA